LIGFGLHAVTLNGMAKRPRQRPVFDLPFDQVSCAPSFIAWAARLSSSKPVRTISGMLGDTGALAAQYRDHGHPAIPSPDGVNFCVFSQNATAVELLLFDSATPNKPARIVTLDPHRNRTADYWHVFVPDLTPGQLYAYRVDGPFDPANGHRFSREKLLLDPYGKCVVDGNYSRAAAMASGDNINNALKNVVVESRSYDWEGDAPLYRPFSQSVIYEMHVAGFTRHPSSGVGLKTRGTFAGVIEKIPHLLSLGVTAVELLPVFQFDPQDAAPGLSNYWGYNPISFFAPHSGYSSRRDALGCLTEFKDMVKALHRAGLEVILDVVYNHTAEGSADGPTLCYRGFENSVYYILKEGDQRGYADYLGCGNTLNTNHAIVRRMIHDSVHYWVSTMHVDGLRFDLASILSRDESGRPMANAPILSDLESDPVLAGIKLIAEAWDTQTYQLGNFAGGNWKEWNSLFRDQVRGFVKADRESARGLASRLLGSPDLYEHHRRPAENSINFITCHDGFTLNDLVSYNHKHNESNLENNRDGTDNNLSWNCGAEGPATNLEIECLRNRQIKNLLTITFLAMGTPMLLMGDEARRTQLGNNNAYCQDNELSWFDWTLLKKHREILSFVQKLIRLRLEFAIEHEQQRRTLTEFLLQAKIRWHGIRLDQRDWGDQSHTLAVTVESARGERLMHLIFNAWGEPLEFQLPPPLEGTCWRRLIDTSLPSPLDIQHSLHATNIEASSYSVQSHSTVVLSSESFKRDGYGGWRKLY
jgi:isoamylase